MQYVRECLQLLYWALFKPSTLSRYVEDIKPANDNYLNPSLTSYSNAFCCHGESAAPHRLKRYARKVWWINLLLPIFIIGSLGLFYNFCWLDVEQIISSIVELYQPETEYFNWSRCSIFLLGWILVLLIALSGKELQDEKYGYGIIALWLLVVFPVLVIGSEKVVEEFFLPLWFGLLLSGLSNGGVFGGILGGVFAGVFGVNGAVAGFGVLGGAFGIMFGIMTTREALIDISEDIRYTVGFLLATIGITVIGVVTVIGISENSLFSGILGGAVVIETALAFIFGGLRVYFWFPELLWMLFLKKIKWNAANCLHLLPPQFDEVIYLPLPFLPGFIAEAYQENQTAARQTIDYLITSTNQQKTATKAISRIAVEECGRCRTAGDIAALRKQLDWLPGQQAGGLTACLEISQDVTAALEGSSPYRQARQLDKVLQKIERQRNALATASTHEATAFGSVLDSWQRILETARNTLREQARHSDEIPQEYLAGPALDPNKAGTLFKGRRDLFRQIETLTLSAQHPTLVMYGGRRTGKTSTLNYLSKWMPSDILPLLVDVQQLASLTTLDSFAEFFAKQIIRSARKVHGVKLPSPESERLICDPFAALFRWIDAVEEAVPDKTLLICLDEFERLDKIVTVTNSHAPLDFLRHLIQHRDRWTLLFAGAHMPEELPAYWSDYLINSQTLRVSYLAKQDTLTLIKEPVEDFPAIYPDEVAEAIWRLTNGQPYFTQLLCHELVEHLNRGKEKTVRMSDLEAVLPAVFERGYQVFREFWDALTEGQRELLLALAEERPLGEEAVKAAPIAPMLVRKEILAQDEGGWSFRVPLLRRWILTKCEE